MMMQKQKQKTNKSNWGKTPGHYRMQRGGKEKIHIRQKGGKNHQIKS